MIKCKDETPETDHTVDMCHEFIAGVRFSVENYYILRLAKQIFQTSQIIESQPRKNRGPYLARLELARLMVKHKFDKEQQFGELTELLLDYFRMFGDKTCCANDLKLFLEYVEPAKRPGFAAQLMQECRINPVTLPSSVSLDMMRFHGCDNMNYPYTILERAYATAHLFAADSAFLRCSRGLE